MSEFTYDVFISYATEERAWVERHLYEPLLKCRIDGRVPRVFLDASAVGVKVGENWRHALASALAASRQIVPVYSALYFAKPNCQWELGIAHDFDPDGRLGRLTAVLKDPDWSTHVPLEIRPIHYLTISTPDWFERLCDKLRFVQSPDETLLQFAGAPPAEIVVNHTLPPVRVRLASTGRSQPPDQEITISAGSADIRGTVTVKSQQATATFSDLFFAVPVDAPIVLEASAPGCESVRSEPFRVVPPQRPAPVPARAEAQDVPVIPVLAHAMFLNGDTVAVIEPKRFGTWDVRGTPRCTPLSISSPPRLWAHSHELLARADWDGRIQCVWATGQTHEWRCTDHHDELTVPGGLTINGAGLLVGLWSGQVFRLVVDRDPEELITVAAGVQALAAAPGCVWIADLNGTLTLCRGGRLVELERHMLEPTIHLLKASATDVVAVGDGHLYKHRIGWTRPVKEPLRLNRVSAVFGSVDCPVVVDEHGSGIRFDADLTIVSRFRVAPGCVPVSADHAGRWTIFQQPDNGRVLMEGRQVIFTDTIGTLAIEPDGKRFMLGDQRGLRVVGLDAMKALIDGGRA